jgi:cyclopropane-fatty-acyl-phospholipid synthase
MSHPGLSLVASTDIPSAVSGRSGWAERFVLRALGSLPRGHVRIELPDGRVCEYGTPAAPGVRLPQGIPADAVIRVLDSRVFRRCVEHGDVGFAEAYIDGDWSTPDLTAVLAWFVHNWDHAPTLSGSKRRGQLAFNLLRLGNRLGHLLRRNSRTQVRHNISAHYDLSNEFFALWLDPSMMYSSAYWTAPDLTLEQAQREKNAHLCQLLRLQPSDHVLEIGTGWGGWALQAARDFGCRVTTLTLSQRQAEFARARIQQAGLGDRVSVEYRDFRDMTGRFDKLVSIEMMEALGHRYQPAFCAAIDRLLRPDGLVALQFITVPDERYDQLRQGVDFIQKHIFPGSLLLSLDRINRLFSRHGGRQLHHLVDLGADYARTLACWQERFDAAEPQVRALGFDERFQRKWTYYLSYCRAAFALRHISVVQALYTRPDNLSL